MKVQQTASVHPKTLRTVSVSQPEFKNSRRSDRKKVNRCRTVKVDSRVWSEAVRLAGARAALIEVRSATEVVVHNNENWRKA